MAAVMALPMFGGSGTAMAQAEVPSSGGFYLYNETGDVFLSRGAGWGTQATVDKYGVPFDISLTDGKYKLTFFDMNNTLGNADGAVYTDNGNNAFTFKASGTGWLAYSESAGKWLTIDANNVMQFTADESVATVWNFKTNAEYAAVRETIKAKQLQRLAAAAGLTGVTDEAAFQAKLASDFVAKDRTSSVANAALRDNINSWTFTAGRNGSNVGGGNGVREIYQGSGTLTQTVSGLAQGIYKVTLNAHYRDGWPEACVSHANNGWVLSNARLEANGYEVQIKDWASEHEGTNDPNSTGKAAEMYAAGKYLNTLYAYVGADGKMTITLNFPQYNGGGWACFNNLTLSYYDDTVSPEDAAALLSTVPTGAMDATVKSELEAAKTAFENTATIPLYNALIGKIEAANASIADYAKVKAALDQGYSLTEPSLATFTEQAAGYQTQYDNGTIADVDATVSAVLALYTKDLVAAQRGENSNMTLLIENADISAGKSVGWTLSGTVGENKKEHWSGKTNNYIEPCEWGASSWTSSFKQDVTLPNGLYTVRVAARASANVIFKLVVGDAEDTHKGIGAVGGTIATDGTEWESVEAGKAAGKTFAKDGAGFGWIYAKVADVKVLDGKLTIGGEATCSVAHEWCSFDDFQLTMVRYYTDAEVAEMEAQVAQERLQTAIEKAQAVDVTTNVGDAGFQIPTSAADELKAAILTAEGIATTSGLQKEEYESAATVLNDAVETFKATAPSAPAADEAFRLVLSVNGYSRDGRAVTCRQNRTDAGLWNMGYWFAPDDNLLQAFYFTPVVDKDNEYNLHFVDAEGGVHYVCNGTVYGGNTSQIRTTEDATKALALRIDDKGKGVYSLYNSTASMNIGSNDDGFFSTNNNSTFKIVPCTKAEVTLNITAAEYATVILPFAAELPAGMEAFTCDAAAEAMDGIRVLTLNPATKLEANVPYIVKGAESTTTLSGYGTHYPEKSLTSGWLTGVYTSQAAPVGSYVLQNGEAGVGFYAVAEGAQPTMGAYRAYLTAEDAAGIRGFIFAEGDATGIESVTAESGKLVDVYTISGTLVRSQVAASKALRGLGKGIYVVGGEKKVVK